MLLLGGGAAAGQVIGVLAMPVIARIFLPEAFGIAALFLSISTIIGSVAAFRYEFAIVLPKDDQAAANLLLLGFLITVLVSLSAFLLVGVFGVRVLVLLNARELVPYRWLFPASISLFGLNQILMYWNTRNRFFYRQGAARVVAVLAKDTSLIGGGLAGYSSGGYMIIARLFGELASPLIFGYFLIRDDLKFIVHNCTWRRIRRLAWRYRKFPLFDTWTALVQTLSVNLPVVVLMKFFSPREAGLFSQGLLLLWLPTNLIGSSIFQVGFERLAEIRASGKSIAASVGDLYRHLFSLGFFPLALVAVIGPDVFGVALGANWVEAGVYARLLVPWVFVNYIYAPLSSVFYVLEKQHANLVFNLTLTLGRLGSLLFGVYFWGDVRAVILLYGLVNLAIYLCVTFYLLRCARVKLPDILSHGLRTAVIAAPFLGLITAAKWTLDFPRVGLIIIGALFCLIYLSVIISRDRQLRTVAVDLFHSKFSKRLL